MPKTYAVSKLLFSNLVQSTRPSEGSYLEQIAREMGPMQFLAQSYAEYHTKSLVCSVGWNLVKFQHFYIVPPLWGPQTFYMLFRGLKQNALSKKHFSCNLFYVQLCTDWTNWRKPLSSLNLTSGNLLHFIKYPCCTHIRNFKKCVPFQFPVLLA